MTVLLHIKEFVTVTFLNDYPIFPQISKPMIPNATRIYGTKTQDKLEIIKLLSFVYNIVLLRKRERERETRRDREGRERQGEGEREGDRGERQREKVAN
jgi:hypothetical protein